MKCEAIYKVRQRRDRFGIELLGTVFNVILFLVWLFLVNFGGSLGGSLGGSIAVLAPSLLFIATTVNFVLFLYLRLCFLAACIVAYSIIYFHTIMGSDKMLHNSRTIVLEYISDPSIFRGVMELGTGGLIALALGSCAAATLSRRSIREITIPGYSCMSMTLFCVWLGIIATIKLLITPRGTLLKLQYAELRSIEPLIDISKAMNVSGMAFLLAAIAVVPIYDAFQEKPGRQRRIKLTILAVFVVYFLGFMELAKGERTSAGLIFAMSAVYVLHRDVAYFKKTMKAGVMLVVAVIGMTLIGIVRNHINLGYIDGEKMQSNLISFFSTGTWMGAFYSSLAVFVEYNRDTLDYYNGLTYIYNLIGILPSAVRELVGIEITDYNIVSNPAIWYRLEWTNGGASIITGAIKNFGIPGFLVLPFIYGLCFSLIETNALDRRGSVFLKSVYFMLWIFFLRIFWYGDIYFAKALLTGVPIYLLFRTRISSAKRSKKTSSGNRSSRDNAFKTARVLE